MGVIKVNCSAAYKDGTFLFGGEEGDEQLVTDVLLRDVPSGPDTGLKAIVLRVIVPKDRAEQLYNGMLNGITQLYVENIKPEV